MVTDILEWIKDHYAIAITAILLFIFLTSCTTTKHPLSDDTQIIIVPYKIMLQMEF